MFYIVFEPTGYSCYDIAGIGDNGQIKSFTVCCSPVCN